MNKIKNALYGAVATVVAFAPAVASAQWNVTNGNTDTNLSNRTIGSQLNVIVKWLLALVGILGVVGFVVAGVFYLTAAGDEDQVSKAKSIMMYSIIGVVVALVGYIAVAAISQVFVSGNASF